MNILDTYWQELEKDREKIESGILLRKLNHIGLQIGFNVMDRQRLLILEITDIKSINEKQLPKWGGIEFGCCMIDSRPNIVMKLKSYEFKDIFCSIATDLDLSLRQIDSMESGLISYKKCIKKWEIFFEKRGLSLLSREEQVGLFGELFFLHKYIIQEGKSLEALDSWRGHERKHQDFVFPKGNVEIKTTTQKQHAKVYISSEKQLDDNGLDNLFLYCLILNEPVQQGHSLNDLVQGIYIKLDSEYDKIRFHDLLIDAGYIDDQKSNYEKPVYSISKEHFFRVESGFPRIIELPSGVGDLAYSISLVACQPFIAEIQSSIKSLLDYYELS